MIILVFFSGVSSCALTCVRKSNSVYVTGVASGETGCALGDRTSIKSPYIAWRLAARCSPPGDRPWNSGSGGDWRPTTRSKLPGGLGLFRLAALEAARGGNLANYGLFVWCFNTTILHLDREMLCHEWVGSWMVVNMWWYKRGGSYPITLAWGYERGRFVCFVLTLEGCCV